MWRLLTFIYCLLPTLLFSQVRFTSNFESGALGRVVSDKDSIIYRKIVIESKPDPVDRCEPRNQRSSRWFYFKMSKLRGDSIVMTIKGSDPLRAMYSYDNVSFSRFSEDEFYKSVLHKRFDADSVYIAYFTPYTYQHLQKKIDRWSRENVVKVDTIGYSYKGIPIQMLRITDPNVSDDDKKGLWIQSRVHPSETPSSFVMEGVIERLLNDNERELLKKTIFYIVPMINPDGVVRGYSRTDAKGINHECNYNSSVQCTAVEVMAVKKYITSIFDDKQGLSLFLNLHAQVAGKSSYWIHTAESSSQILFNKKKLISAHTELYPQKKRGNDDYVKRRGQVPEGWIYNNWGDRCVAMTLEVPYTYYSDRDMWVDEDNLASYGGNLVDVAANAVGVGTSKSVILDNKPARRGWQGVCEGLYYGDNYLIAKKKSAKAIFETPKLDVGLWNIYLWDVKEEIWKFSDVVDIKRTKAVPIGIKSKEKGEMLDAIMIRKDDSK